MTVDTTFNLRQPLVRLFEPPTVLSASKDDWVQHDATSWKLEGCRPVYRRPDGQWQTSYTHKQETIWFIPASYTYNSIIPIDPNTLPFPQWIECYWDRQAGMWIARLDHSPRPLHLTPVGGSSGSASSAATYTYEVIDALTTFEYFAEVDPVVFPHRHRRPAIGQLEAASFGIGYYTWEGQFIIGFVNETPRVSTC